MRERREDSSVEIVETLLIRNASYLSSADAAFMTVQVRGETDTLEASCTPRSPLAGADSHVIGIRICVDLFACHSTCLLHLGVDDLRRCQLLLQDRNGQAGYMTTVSLSCLTIRQCYQGMAHTRVLGFESTAY